MREWMRRKRVELFGVDLRSLGVLRIGLALLVLEDLARRALDFRQMYTDFGILPRASLRGYGPDSTYTLHGLASGSAPLVAALFVLAAVAAVALLLGWRTRLATFVSWVLLASIQWRNPPLNNGGDVMLRMLLFWGLFLPLDARFALPGARARPAAPRLPDAYVSAATVALLLQICFVYGFAVASRTGPDWWEGRALSIALHFDLFATSAAVWLRGLEPLLPPLTFAALALEMVGPLLAFSPVWTGPLRTATVALFLGLHAALAALFSLGHFQAVFMVAWIAFLPAWFWDRVAARVGPVPATAPGAVAPPPRARLASLREVTVSLLLVYVFLCNLDTVKPALLARLLPAGWKTPAEWLRIDQRWGLFAPNPPVNDGWYVVVGHLANEREVDLLDPGRPATLEKPPLVSASLPVHLRYFFLALELDAQDPRWADYGRYQCRAWNETHAGAERLARVDVYFVRETTKPSGPTREGVLTLLAHTCA